MLYVLNLGDDEAADIDRVIEKHHLEKLASKPQTAVVPFCGKIEAELAELADAEAAEMMSAYGLEGIGTRPADSGELPVAGADFVSHLRRAGMPRVDHRARHERAASRRRDSQRHRARIHQGGSGELGRSAEGGKFCGRAREGAGASSKAKSTSCRMAT